MDGWPFQPFAWSLVVLWLGVVGPFPAGLPPSGTEREASHLSPERTLSCSTVGDLEPME